MRRKEKRRKERRSVGKSREEKWDFKALSWRRRKKNRRKGRRKKEKKKKKKKIKNKNKRKRWTMIKWIDQQIDK